MNENSVDIFSTDPLVKLAFSKMKMMTEISLVLVVASDTENYKPGQKEAPTKGLLWLEHHVVKFPQCGGILYESSEPNCSPGWKSFDYEEHTSHSYSMGGHMLAHTLAVHINRQEMKDWLIIEILVRYLAECYEILGVWNDRKHLEFDWYKFARLIRNAVNHNYRFHEDIHYFEHINEIKYQDAVITKNDEGKHLFEWDYCSPWLILALAKDVESYLRNSMSH